jgi:hypothetical protein
MRLVIILFAVIAVVFLALMVLAPSGQPGQDPKTISAKYESDGPPPWASAADTVMGWLTPGARPQSGCTATSGTGGVVAADRADYRLLRAELTAGNAAKLTFSPNSPRPDGDSGPYTLCLFRTGAGIALPSDCGNHRPVANGSVPVGAAGGSFAVAAIGPGVVEIKFCN